MVLKSVTLTGADDSSKIADMERLSLEYPFVEWGFLLSMQKTGDAPRYPSLRDLSAFGLMEARKSVHLCGRLARDVVGTERFPIETALQLVPGAQRVQVNLGQSIDHYSMLCMTASGAARRFSIQVILQAYSFAVEAVQNMAEGSGYRELISWDDNYGVVFLHDASGGRGIVGEFEKPVNKDYVGFAGGVTPENVLETLSRIERLDIPNNIWLDVETGVTTYGVFDMDKAEAILRTVKPYIQR